MTRISSLVAFAARPRFAFRLAFLLACVVAVTTLVPSDNLPSAPGGDKMHHFIAFGVLAFPLALVRPYAAIWIVVLVAAYGGMIEIIQPFVGRNGSVADALANTIGAICGTVLGATLHMVFLRDQHNRN